MNGEGRTGKVGVAPGNGEVASLEGAPDTIRPTLPFAFGQAMPPRQSWFCLRFVGNKGRGIVLILLTAAGVLVSFILGYRRGRVVGVFPAPVEGNGMNRPTPLFQGHADLNRAIVVHCRKGRVENPTSELPQTS